MTGYCIADESSRSAGGRMAEERGRKTGGRIAQTALKAPIYAYRKFISPLKPPTCRFYPTCSQYALEAIEKHGAAKGGWLAAKRILRCHPFHPGGYDPVPDNGKEDKPHSGTNGDVEA